MTMIFGRGKMENFSGNREKKSWKPIKYQENSSIEWKTALPDP
jgi:hypothetical protein